MKLSLKAPTPLEYFAALVHSDSAFMLLEAAISIGQDEYPELDVSQVQDEIDELTARLKRRIPKDAGKLQKLRILNQFFYRDLGFAANANDFANPDNSLVHCVLEKRLGIPISIALIWLELAQSLGLAARGVAFPGHFLVKVHLTEGQVVIDPLTGSSLSRDELLERLEPYRDLVGLQDGQEFALGHYLQPATAREIIGRMLRNLQEIHATQEDWPRLLAVLERLLVLLPRAWSIYRDRGLVYAELSRDGHALEDLETYLANSTHAADRNAILARVSELKRMTR